MTYLLALDQGTSSSRSIVFNACGVIVAQAQRELTQIYPQPGWVEHDPMEIWRTQLATVHEALAKAGIAAHQVRALGITNQREATVVWHPKTGLPLHHAIVWQDRRPSPLVWLCESAAWRTRFRPKPVCWWMRISRAPSSNGFWTTCPAPANSPNTANWRLARSTAG